MRPRALTRLIRPYGEHLASQPVLLLAKHPVHQRLTTWFPTGLPGVLFGAIAT